MMFTHARALALTVLPFLGDANPIALYPRVDRGHGHLQCCALTETAGSTGIVVSDGNILIGVNCSPIAGSIGVGPGTSSCSGKTVCCSNTSVGGLVAENCVPVDL